MKIRYRKPFRHPPEKEVSWDSWGSPEEAAAAQIVTQWQTPQWQAGTGAILPSHGGLRICVHFGSTLPWKRQLRKTSEPTRNTQDLFLRILREDSGRFWKTDEDWWRLMKAVCKCFCNPRIVAQGLCLADWSWTAQAADFVEMVRCWFMGTGKICSSHPEFASCFRMF